MPWARNGTGTTGNGTTSPVSVTVPAGTVATDTCVFSVSGDTANTAAGTWTSSRSGITFNTLVPPTNANNTSCNAVQATGLIAGDAVLFVPTAAATYRVDHHYRTAPLTQIGTAGTRGGTTQATTVAPALTVTPGSLVVAFCVTRTNTAGTAISSVVNSNGRTTTQRQIDYKVATSPSTNVAVYEFTETGTSTGTTTFTDTQPSGNGLAVHFAEAGPPAVPSGTFFPFL